MSKIFESIFEKLYNKYLVKDGRRDEMSRVSYFFEKKIEKMLSKYKEEYIAMISDWIVVDITFGKRYKLTHEFDSREDMSGRLQVEKTNLSVDEFSCLGEFLAIYSGKSVVSHLPGRMLFHHTYEEQYIDRLNSHFVDMFERDYLTEEQQTIKGKLNSSFYLEEDELEIAEELAEIEVYLKSYISYVLEELKKENLKWFYTKGLHSEM